MHKANHLVIEVCIMVYVDEEKKGENLRPTDNDGSRVALTP